MAAGGGLQRIAEAMADPDPHAGLLKVIAIFCDFWSFDPGALGRLHAAGASDPEFDASVRERNERRRHLLAILVGRIAEGGELRSKTGSNTTRGDLADVLFALTSFPLFSHL